MFFDVHCVFHTQKSTNQMDKDLWTRINLEFCLDGCHTGLCYPIGSLIVAGLQVMSNIVASAMSVASIVRGKKN